MYASAVPSCFIAMPITTPAVDAEVYREDADHFSHVLEVLFEPAIENAGFEPVRPKAQGSDLIHAEIVRNLETADLVLCDISSLNPNVFFELGIRTALDRPVCLVRDSTTTDLPFDTGVLNFHEYDHQLAAWSIEEEVQKLTEHLKVTGERSKGHNGLWQYFGLTQRGTEAIEASSEAPEGAAMAVLLEELRALRATLGDVQPRHPLSPVDRATRARWLEMLSSEAEPHGSKITDFVGKAQEVAANDGVRLSLADVSDEIVALEMRGGELGSRAGNLIASLARSYGIEVRFMRMGEADGR